MGDTAQLGAAANQGPPAEEDGMRTHRHGLPRAATTTTTERPGTRRPHPSRVLAVLLALTVPLLATSCQRELAHFAAGEWVDADINASGLIVGCVSRDGTPVEGFVLRPGHTDREALAAPAGTVACPAAVSDSGLAVGTAGDAAFRWNLENGTFAALPALPDGKGTGTSARDVNDDGVVVGSSPNASGQFVPVRWSPDGHPTALVDTQGAPAEGHADSVNRAGAASGLIGGHIVTWAPGATAATFLMSNFAGATEVPINDAGTVVSRFATKSGNRIIPVTYLFPADGSAATQAPLRVDGWDGFSTIVWEGSDTLVGVGVPAGQTTWVPVRYSVANGTLTPIADPPPGDVDVLAANPGHVVLMLTQEDDGSHRLVEVS
jgi:hypothetical protein